MLPSSYAASESATIACDQIPPGRDRTGVGTAVTVHQVAFRGFANPVDPTSAELRAWAYNPDSVMAAEHAGGVGPAGRGRPARRHAAWISRSTADCPARRFALHCLYIYAADAIRTKFRAHPKRRLRRLVEKAEDEGDELLVLWAHNTRMLLAVPDLFDYREWCEGGLVRQPRRLRAPAAIASPARAGTQPCPARPALTPRLNARRTRSGAGTDGNGQALNRHEVEPGRWRIGPATDSLRCLSIWSFAMSWPLSTLSPYLPPVFSSATSAALSTASSALSCFMALFGHFLAPCPPFPCRSPPDTDMSRAEHNRCQPTI